MLILHIVIWCWGPNPGLHACLGKHSTLLHPRSQAPVPISIFKSPHTIGDSEKHPEVDAELDS